MRLIDRLIKKFEEESVEFASAGMTEEAKQSRMLASKYTEMKYNGHTHSLTTEINDKWKKK
jgi:phosphoribosyl-ATP pyrophosphohydrolase|tara:strand:+ start:637 stop:819 length:183 start_codon:yes stop_codon:yes gene_type:complete